MDESDYPDYIARGIVSLKAKYGFIGYTKPEKPILKSTGETVDILFTDGVTRTIKLATPELCSFIEQSLRRICSPYEGHIETMDEDEINAFSFAFMMALDIERGLGFGQIPHLEFNHSDEFEEWEKNIWNRVKLREKEIGME